MNAELPDHEVIDDLLDAPDFAALWPELQRLRYDLPGEWQPLWSLVDPRPAVSGTFFWSRSPVGHGMDQVVERIVAAMRASPLFGAAGQDWDDVAFRVYLQCRGSRLAGHGDSQFAGTAAFYAHPQWSADWGGELIFPDRPDDRASGRYVLPRPNRLVLIRRGVWHRTGRVDADAGGHLRCTIAAFAQRAVRG